MDTPRKRSRVALFVAVSFLCFSAAPAQFPWSQTPPPSRSAPNPPANCEISGLVIDAGTGKPMPSAQVMVFSPPSGVIGGVVPVVVPTSPCIRCDPLGVLQDRLRTNARGQFAVRKMEPGMYIVSAVADGYAEQVFKVPEKYMRPDAFWLRPGQERHDIVVRLPRASVLAGRVIDDHGEPVPGSLVQVLQFGPGGARWKILEPVTGTRTDDRGKYRVFGLLPGRYYLVAGYEPDFELRAFNLSDLELQFYSASSSRLGARWKDFPPLFFYPRGNYPSRARPVNLEAGQVVSNLNISVRPMTQTERAAMEKSRLLPSLTGACEASGTVVNAVTGHPLRKSWLSFGPRFSLYGLPAVQSRTDGQGRFDLKSIPCNWGLPLAARANGFVEQPEESAFGQPYGGHAEAQFRSQPNITGLLIRMVPTGVIAGEITDPQGNPVECADVTVARAYASSNLRQWLTPYRETVTDDQGHYRLFDLPEGQYYVAAQTREIQPASTRQGSPADLRLSAVSPGVSASPYLYYPSATTPSDASVVRLAPGEQRTRVDFSLSEVPTYEISGKVQGAAWRAAGEKVRFILVPTKRPFGISLQEGDVAQLDKFGHFRISGVPSGSYVLWAVLPTGISWYAANAPITVSHANVTGVTLDPEGDWTLHGHLTVEDQEHGYYFRYRIVAERGSAGLLFQRVQANDVHSGDSFALKGMFPGRYMIRIEMLPSNGYIKSAMFGSKDLRGNELDIPQHRPVGTLEIVASWDGAQIQGTVLGPDGRPALQAAVILAPAPQLRSDPWLFKSGLTDSGGHFLLQGIAPGEYTLFAWNRVAYDAWLQPEFLEGAAGHGVAVAVAAGQRQTVTLHEIVASGAASR